MSDAPAEVRLVLDGARCDGHGVCALVMPERVSLDPWGYARVDSSALENARSLARARRVVRACPAGALTLVGDARERATTRSWWVVEGLRRGGTGRVENE